MRRYLLFSIAALLLSLGLAQRPAGPLATPITLSPAAGQALLEALSGPVGEYAAYATYATILQHYGNLEPYASILRSEANHIRALQRQLGKYGLVYPKTNPYLGKISLAPNLVQIAQEEAQTEIDNVAMYDQLLGRVQDYPDLIRVFSNLRAASLQVHLPLYKAAAQNGGSLSLAQMQSLRWGQ